MSECSPEGKVSPPCLHFTQIKGLVPLQLSSSHLSQYPPSYHQAGVWPCTFRLSQISLIISSERVFSHSHLFDQINQIDLIWFQKFLTSLLSLRLSTFLYCHWCAIEVDPALLWQAADIFCLYFFAGNCGEGESMRRQSKVAQAVVTVVRRYAENSPSAKTQGPEPNFLDPFCQFSYTFSGGFWRNNLR